MPARRAKFAPPTAWAESSENQRPWTCHPGFVEATPVLKRPPPFGTGTLCRYQVPIRVVRNGTFTVDEFVEVTATGTSRKGAKPITLFRQKIVFSFPRSASDKKM